MISVVTDSSTLIRQIIPGGVAKHFFKLKLGKVESLVALAVRESWREGVLKCCRERWRVILFGYTICCFGK